MATAEPLEPSVLNVRDSVELASQWRRVSQARGGVLRREALELALYTFKYVDGIDSVLDFVPPRPKARPTYTLFFRRSDFASQLARPLRDTLGVGQAGVTTAPVADRIERLTVPRLFRFKLAQSSGGGAILVLDPAALGH